MSDQERRVDSPQSPDNRNDKGPEQSLGPADLVKEKKHWGDLGDKYLTLKRRLDKEGFDLDEETMEDLRAQSRQIEDLIADLAELFAGTSTKYNPDVLPVLFADLPTFLANYEYTLKVIESDLDKALKEEESKTENQNEEDTAKAMNEEEEETPALPVESISPRRGENASSEDTQTKEEEKKEDRKRERLVLDAATYQEVLTGLVGKEEINRAELDQLIREKAPGKKRAVVNILRYRGVLLPIKSEEGKHSVVLARIDHEQKRMSSSPLDQAQAKILTEWLRQNIMNKIKKETRPNKRGEQKEYLVYEGELIGRLLTETIEQMPLPEELQSAGINRRQIVDGILTHPDLEDSVALRRSWNRLKPLERKSRPTADQREQKPKRETREMTAAEIKKRILIRLEFIKSQRQYIVGEEEKRRVELEKKLTDGGMDLSPEDWKKLESRYGLSDHRLASGEAAADEEETEEIGIEKDNERTREERVDLDSLSVNAGAGIKNNDEEVDFFEEKTAETTDKMDFTIPKAGPNKPEEPVKKETPRLEKKPMTAEEKQTLIMNLSHTASTMFADLPNPFAAKEEGKAVMGFKAKEAAIEALLIEFYSQINQQLLRGDKHQREDVRSVLENVIQALIDDLVQRREFLAVSQLLNKVVNPLIMYDLRVKPDLALVKQGQEELAQRGEREDPINNRELEGQTDYGAARFLLMKFGK